MNARAVRKQGTGNGQLETGNRKPGTAQPPEKAERELSGKAQATLNFLARGEREDRRFLDKAFLRGVEVPLGEGLMSLGALQKELEAKVGFGTTVPSYVLDMRMKESVRNGTAVPLHEGCML